MNTGDVESVCIFNLECCVSLASSDGLENTVIACRLIGTQRNIRNRLAIAGKGALDGDKGAIDSGITARNSSNELVSATLLAASKSSSESSAVLVRLSDNHGEKASSNENE